MDGPDGGKMGLHEPRPQLGQCVSNWFAGAHPFDLTNNQGMEGTYAQIKAHHTFRSEVSLNEFLQITENLVGYRSFVCSCYRLFVL